MRYSSRCGTAKNIDRIFRQIHFVSIIILRWQNGGKLKKNVNKINLSGFDTFCMITNDVPRFETIETCLKSKLFQMRI